jgi:hypothetical protein
MVHVVEALRREDHGDVVAIVHQRQRLHEEGRIRNLQMTRASGGLLTGQPSRQALTVGHQEATSLSEEMLLVRGGRRKGWLDPDKATVEARQATG